jgi:hypothetical protein
MGHALAPATPPHATSAKNTSLVEIGPDVAEGYESRGDK